MAITWQDFESGSNGDALSPANSGSVFVVSTGGTQVISTTTPPQGTRCARMTATASSGGVYLGRSGLSTSAFARTFALRVITDISADMAIWWLGTGSREMSIELTPTRTLKLKDAAGTVIWTSSAIPLNTWVRVGVYVTQNATTGTVVASWWTGAFGSGTPDSTSGNLTGRNTGSAAYTDERLGVKCTTNTITGVIDIDVAGWDPAATAMPGPYGSPIVTLGSNKGTLYPGEAATLTGTASSPAGTIVSTSFSTTLGTLSGSGLTRTLTAPPSLTDQTATVTFTATDDSARVTTITTTVAMKASAWRLVGSPGVPLVERLIT